MPQLYSMPINLSFVNVSANYLLCIRHCCIPSLHRPRASEHSSPPSPRAHDCDFACLPSVLVSWMESIAYSVLSIARYDSPTLRGVSTILRGSRSADIASGVVSPRAQLRVSRPSPRRTNKRPPRALRSLCFAVNACCECLLRAQNPVEQRQANARHAGRHAWRRTLVMFPES
eukprot:1162694-Pleurochrysis_carterae.AAC.10